MYLLHWVATIKGSHLLTCTFIVYFERIISHFKILAPSFRFIVLFLYCLPVTQGTFIKESSLRRGVHCKLKKKVVQRRDVSRYTKYRLEDSWYYFCYRLRQSQDTKQLERLGKLKENPITS
jgi:hypothetical protein